MSIKARVLVTGASGFIGSQLVRRLLYDGHSVSVILRANGNRWRLAEFKSDVSVYVGDLADEDFVQRSVSQARPEWVFGCAAYGAYSSETDTERMKSVNIDGLGNILRAAANSNVSSFVNIGSCFEYGEGALPIDEQTAPTPTTAYGKSRLASTALCQYVAENSSLDVTTLRLYSTYGQYEDPRRLIAKLCLSRVRGAWPDLSGPAVVRDYMHISDVVDALLLCAAAAKENKSSVYNLGNGVAVSLDELVTAVSKIIDMPVPQNSNRVDTGVPWVANSTLIRSELGWTPKVSLSDGLRSTVEWIEQNVQYYGNEISAAPTQFQSL